MKIQKIKQNFKKQGTKKIENFKQNMKSKGTKKLQNFINVKKMRYVKCQKTKKVVVRLISLNK